ncbi:MAG: protein kinase [Actinomycetota bacterium]
MDPFSVASAAGGRYRLVEPVRDSAPHGAWRAVDEDSGAEVAVKTLGICPAGDAAAQARLRLAARAVIQLAGPRIAAVHGYGEGVLPGEQFILYLVRDLVRGQTLDQRLAEGPLSAGAALRVAAEVAGALAVTHQAGMAHGHLVPANIVLGPGADPGAVTVTDAGLPPPHDDHAGAGLPDRLSFAAPELSDGQPATPASDMYALGLIFAVCLGGISARNGAGTARGGVAASDAAAGEPAADLPAPEHVPAAMAALWAACLGPDPLQRPTAARAVALSEQVLGPAPSPADTQLTALLPAGDQVEGPGPGWWSRVRRPSRGALLAGAAAAVLAAVVTVLVSSAGGGPPRHPAPVTAAGPQTSTAPGAQPSSAPAPLPGDPGSLATVQRIWNIIRDDVTNGRMRQDVGLDLDHLIGPVRTELASGQQAQVDQLASVLHAKIWIRVSEGAMSLSAARALSSEITALQRAADGGN